MKREKPRGSRRKRRQPWEKPGLSRADRVIRFLEALPVTSGPLAGSKFKARPWQRRWLRRVYRTDKGRRVVRTAVLSLGRKNGKTTLAAMLTLCHLCGPEAESRGECYTAANDRQQASRIFAECCAIIERVEWMRARVSIRRHSKELEDIGAGGTGSYYCALSADVGTKHGLSPSFFVADEMGQAPSRELFDVLDSAMGARAEPLALVISTQAASDTAPLSELIDYGLRVQRGEIEDDPTFDLELFTAPPEADPWKPSTWKLANPALGDFRSAEDVERMALQAQRTPSRENSFRNLVLNQRVDTTAQFLSAAAWQQCSAPVDLDTLKGRPCYGGLDLGASRDLTALVLCFTDGQDGKIDVLPFFWIAGDLREREDEDRAPYSTWARQGFLMSGGDKTTDPRVIALKVAELHGRHNIRGLAFDRWRIEDLRRELDAIGCTVPLVPHGQGFVDMSPAVDTLERLAIEGALRTGAHPVLTMCVGNTKCETDAAGNRKPSKKRSTGRIDGLVATAMALAMIGKAPKPKPRSVYEGRGLLVLA